MDTKECNVVRGYTFQSDDGVFVRIEEAPERTHLILSLTRFDGGVSHIETARLSKAQWDAIYDIRYKIDIHESPDTTKPEP